MALRLRGLFDNEWRIIGSAIGTIRRRDIREGLAADVRKLIEQKYGQLNGKPHPYDWKEWDRHCGLDNSN